MSLSLCLAGAVLAGVVAGAVGALAPAPVWTLCVGGAAAVCQRRAWWRLRDALALVVLAMWCAAQGTAATEAALHAPLRTVLEQRLGGFALESAAAAPGDEPLVLEGRLMADAVPATGGPGAIVRMASERVWLGESAVAVSGGVSLTVLGELAHGALGEWRAGRLVRAPVRLRRPARYLNRGVPDSERALALRGITLVGTVKSAALVEVRAPASRFAEGAAAVRARVRAAIARHVTSRDAQAGAVAVAILIGERASMTADTTRRLQEAGTFHVIAISGGNIALLAAALLTAQWLLGLRGRYAALLTVVLLWLYALAITGGPSVTRATTMAAVHLVLRALDHRTSPVHAIALTGAGILYVDPLAVVDVGFWLTYAATAALLLAAARVPLAELSWTAAPAAVVIGSVAAELLLVPIAATVFQRITLAGLALNLVAVPCMAIVQLAAALTVVFDATGPDWAAPAAGWVTWLGATGLLQSAHLVELAPWTTWRVPPPSAIVVCAYYGVLGTWCWLRRPGVRTPGSRRAARASGAAVIIGWLWIALAPASLVRARGDGQLHLTMMDVGQGDAVLVTFPDGRTLLVDAGGVSTRGDFDVGDRVVGPALRARGLRGLDYLAVTHGDADHIGGAATLVREFLPREVWAGTFVANHLPTLLLQQVARDLRTPWRWLQAGDRLQLGAAELWLHHPRPPDWERQKVRNDDSLVMEIRHGQVSVLLTGDIGTAVEHTLLDTLELLPRTVLKAAHHGSATSSGGVFLQRVQPQVVLISAGRGNPYGHPAPVVLSRYERGGTAVFRTDQDGQIELVTDGRELSVTTYTGRRQRW